MQKNVTLPANRIFGFDIARAFSMFYIVGVLHLTGYTDLAVSHNHAMVSLIWSSLGCFTFLSAYLLASRYAFATLDDVITFYRKRVMRFYPLYLVSSLLLLAIGFNTWPETWKGLLGISPFWKPQQHTLWYIAMLIGFYIVTPLLCTHRLKSFIRIGIFASIAVLTICLQKVFHSVDPRFFYYYLVYGFGIMCATSLKAQTTKILHSKITLTTLIVYLPVFCYLAIRGNRAIMMAEGYVGIIVILNLAVLIGEKWQNNYRFSKLVHFLSYSSMCMYLFHREIYWMLLKLVQPVTDWGGVSYLFFVGLPLIMILSYWIQKVYDTICKSILI